MSAEIIDGRALANAWLDELAIQFRAIGTPIHLATIIIGDDPSLKTFIKVKQKAAQSVGVTFSSYEFSSNEIDEAQETLGFLSKDDSVDGIIVELPLPKSWNQEKFLSLISQGKDVDCISLACEEKFYDGKSAIMPPSVIALKHALDSIDFSVSSTSCAVIGNGKLIGRPIAHWLKSHGAKVSIIDDATKNPQTISSSADLVVAGSGVVGLVHNDWIKKDAIVIDFGCAPVDGKFVGDVDFNSVKLKAGAITPVPGGMGPLVVAAVLENLLFLSIH